MHKGLGKHKAQARASISTRKCFTGASLSHKRPFPGARNIDQPSFEGLKWLFVRIQIANLRVANYFSALKKHVLALSRIQIAVVRIQMAKLIVAI